ncbi:hypothetical protein BRADI_3g38596v3 [Brachypodium distachyon]|uniref:Uncharacterized protein n=1 Tax=Brachypodium distachyon TaxID=15368 RepID=A0A0Q3QAD9_BRADI|nr:hypothetical protein BRADI_3g38596v3 [Brachypodium distachyon]
MPRGEQRGTDVSGRELGLFKPDKRGPPCQQGDNSEVPKDTMPVAELDNLPEDILHHIHSLLSLRDAACAACVSRTFLSAWRCFPKLTFNWNTLRLNMNEGTPYDRAKKHVDRICHILENHSGIGVKELKLQLRTCTGNVVTANHLDIWLQTAVKSGILEELYLILPRDHSPEYNFSCLLLSRVASSIQSLFLSSCAFRPTLIIGCLRNLKRVYLILVPITEEELGCFLSCAISLEKLRVYQCNEITFLKIPYHLQRLHSLKVRRCKRLETIEIYAPKVTRFTFSGSPTKLSITDSSQLKMALSTPGSPDKFLQLRHLKIYCSGRRFLNFVFLSLVPFIEACPVLETFFLSVSIWQELALEDSDAESWHIRQTPGFRHDNLNKVSITGIWSRKSLIELACQVLENCSSLRCLALDTTCGYDDNATNICKDVEKEDVMEALKGVEAIQRYVRGKVPSSVDFKVFKPCDRCRMCKL